MPRQILILIIFSLCAIALPKDNPYLKLNNSWITISGTVDSVKPNRFNLDYGDGKVTVEMDDGDRDADAYKLIKGDRVSVTGKIDRDLFEKTKIEAASVYVKNIATTFYSSSVDEEDFRGFAYYPHDAAAEHSVRLYGKVANVVGRQFTLKNQDIVITVDTRQMSFNPLDSIGYPKLDEGDYVSVSGKLTNTFWGNKHLKAEYVFKYFDESARNKNKS